MTTTSRNKALVEEFFERINDHDLDVVDELCADGFAVEINRKGAEDSAIGTEGVKAMYEEYHAAFSGFRHDVDEMVAEGDLVAVFLLTSGRHVGEFRGIRPTGNDVEIEDTGLIRIEDERIVDLRPLSDMLGLFEQLGASLDR